MAIANRISKVAVVGAGGNCGSYIAASLLETGEHRVTAITRVGSKSKLPEGVALREVDYENHETLVEALRGQDALVITLSGHAPEGTEMRLIEAAAEADVPWVLPNEWSPDTANEQMVKDVFVFRSKVAARNAIADLGKSSYIAISTGFWYEWSLAIPAAFGISFSARTATLFDQGETKICTSTWPQVGRAVAALLSQPIKSEAPDKNFCLEDIKNQVVYVNSFTVSQEDMLDSAFRVTSTKRSDWTITTEPAHERYATGIQEIKAGKRIGFAKMMYTRVFYADGCGDFEHSKGTLNKILNLPKEDIDEATGRAFERSKTFNPMG